MPAREAMLCTGTAAPDELPRLVGGVPRWQDIPVRGDRCRGAQCSATSAGVCSDAGAHTCRERLRNTSRVSPSTCSSSPEAHEPAHGGNGCLIKDLCSCPVASARFDRLNKHDLCWPYPQVPATYVGRVCCDAEGRLNDQSVMLEGGVADSAGARVRLDLSQARAGASR